MEQFDVLDRQGRPTGQILDRAQRLALGEGQYDLGVHIYVHNAAGDYLLQRRALTKFWHPGCWDVVLGHCIAGESSQEAALREPREEMGLAVPPKTMRRVGRVFWPEARHLIDVYFCAAEFDPAALTLQKEEVMDAAGISAEAMRQAVEAMSFRPGAYRALVAAEIRRLGAPRPAPEA